MSAIVPTHEWNLPAEGPAPDPRFGGLNLPPLLLRLLRRRGFAAPEEIAQFLEPSAARLHRPDTLPDIEKATGRILAALEKKERILVCGDYDVDGVTGTALLSSTLRTVGADCLTYLPHREAEGYGLSLKGIAFARDNACRLIVTNDCGTSDHEAVAESNRAGIDVIVTDHHEPGPELPPAFAVVNPKRTGSSYPFRELCGCGVAFKLAWSVLAALKRPREDLTGLLDLVGLATIADIVPLLDENRIIARLGLLALRSSPRRGIQALLAIAELGNGPLSSRSIGFGLAPRINAAGRVGHAELALRLMLTADQEEARAIAAELDRLNRSRQALEETILTAATERIESEKLQEQRVVVVAGEGWHQGVIGIVASKLVDRYWRPCIVVALDGESGKGSARSVDGFDLHAALTACSRHLVAFGGHRYAAGLSVRRGELPALGRAMNEYAAALSETVFQPTLHIEAVAGLDELDDSVLAGLARLEPFGPDNSEPIFASLGLEVVGYPRRVGRDHLKFRVRSGAAVFDAIAWGRSADLLNIEVGRAGHLDICYTVKRDTFGGRNRVQLEVQDLRTSGAG